MPGYAIAVHGGCGPWDGRDTRAALRGMRAAIEAARRILAGGGSALPGECKPSAIPRRSDGSGWHRVLGS